MAASQKSSVTNFKNVTVMRAVSAEYLNTNTALFVGYLTEGSKKKQKNVEILLSRMDIYRERDGNLIDFHDEFELVDAWLKEQEAELGLKRQDYKDQNGDDQAAIIQEDMNARRTYAHYRNGAPVNWRGAHFYEEQIDDEAQRNRLNWAKRLEKINNGDGTSSLILKDLTQKQKRAFSLESQFSRNTTDCINLWEAPLQEVVQLKSTIRTDYIEKLSA